jgi:hypothetical protein
MQVQRAGKLGRPPGALRRQCDWYALKASARMGTSQVGSRSEANPGLRRRLQAAIIVFFSAVALSLLIVYAVHPEVYVQVLGAKAPATERYPLVATAFCAAILLFIAVLVVGVVRRWRWLYWLLALAFTISALQVPAGALELAGVLPDPFPAWYTIYRSVVALAEAALGIWLLVVWRRWGVWAEGRRRN